jgi:hypothetical protein
VQRPDRPASNRSPGNLAIEIDRLTVPLAQDGENALIRIIVMVGVDRENAPDRLVLKMT